MQGSLTTVGSLKLSSLRWLAPLESVSDAGFRRLCWELGAGFTWTEMIRARGLVRGNKSTFDLIDTFEPEVPTGVQLLVTTENELRGALDAIEKAAATTHPHFRNISAIDLNFGCPSPDVVRIGAGPALLKRRAKMRAIFETLRTWKAETSLPIGMVGVKIRLGLHAQEKEHEVYLPIVEAANETLDYLIVHARHARQESASPADWRALAKAKARATIPLLGNGDGFTAADVLRMERETGCDGVLIARGAIRSPWIFRELTGKGAGLPTAAELAAAEKTYFETAARYGSKEKFVTWHREGFERLRKRVGGSDAPFAVPKNSNIG